MKYFEALNLIKALGRVNGNLCDDINDYRKNCIPKAYSCEECIIYRTRKKYKLINICNGSAIFENDLNSYYNVREEKLKKLLEL